MSRSGYSDDAENVAMWRGHVSNAIRGKRGQKLLLDLVAALDAMPEKKLFKGHLVTPEGGVCALGAVGLARGIDMERFERHIDEGGHCDDPETLACALGRKLNAAYQLIMEIQYLNDEFFDCTWDVANPDRSPGKPQYLRRDYTPEERWRGMRDWAVRHLSPVVDP